MPKPDPDLETIDPTALANVSGGASGSSDGDAAIMTALTGIVDSLSSLSKKQSNSGFGANEMMLFMMMMQQRNAPVVAAAPQPTNWTWDANGGYWIVK